MTQYFACKMDNIWKLIKEENASQAFNKSFGKYTSPNYAYNCEIVPLGTKKLEATNRFTNLEKGLSQISHCNYCGIAFIIQPNRNEIRLCPGDCGHSIMLNGQTL